MLTNDYGEISWIKVGLVALGVVIFALLGDFLFAHTNSVRYTTSHVTRMEESSTLHQYCAAYHTTHRYVTVSDGHGGYRVKEESSTSCAVYAYYRTYGCNVYAEAYSEYYSNRCFETGFRLGEPVNVMITIQQDRLRIFPPYEVYELQVT